jgi:uncharacterized protein YecT (DUF1311 family)
MKYLFIATIGLIMNTSLAQQYPWTGKCDQAQSVAEMNDCMTKSCEEAKVFFENTYNTLFKKVQTELKKAKKGTVQFDILSKYNTYLPRLKKSLSDNALCMSELDAAGSVGGSEYDAIKAESFMKNIENNITLLKNMDAELPSFN